MSLLVVLAGCQVQQPPQEQSSTISTQRTEELYGLSVQLVEYLNTGNNDAALAMMDETMTSAMEGKLDETWKQLTDSAGAFIETGTYIGTSANGYDVLEMTLVFESAKMIQRAVFTSNNQLSGLFYRDGELETSSAGANAAADRTVPNSATETAVIVDAGEGYPLNGLLTMPKNEAPIATIVMVHGSGPSDMNETIGANAPLRDLAYFLANNGIATLRYDKRTYTYDADVDEATITLDEEVATDALAAVNLVKSYEGINGDKVYLLGHSMGGGLLSYINSLGANCAGYIIMAGTPRNIWELVAEQNLLVADDLEQSGDTAKAEEIRDYVEQETQKAAALASLGGDEIVFGMRVNYLREFDRIDALAHHLSDGLPILVLQGEKDRQVTMTDFALWQEGLASHPNAKFISYPTLNHLFGHYTGDPIPLAQMVQTEYAQRTPVSDEVIADITAWITAQS
jgi:alpha-beta hydrolase superfamily lysophospholipase